MKKYVNNSFVNKSPLEYKNGTEAVTSLPVTLYTDGQPVSSYTIKGNTTTSGTPSPSNPITIEGVGDLVTSGEHAGQYEISISSNQTTTNIYLGSVQSNREIKKIEYTGAADESWTIVNEGTANAYVTNLGNPAANQGVDNTICTHYESGEIYNGNTNTGILVVSNGAIRIRDTNAASMSVSSFKSYLAAQYANGTPLTVYYVLATAETATVNEPLMKIGTYADTLSNATPIPTTGSTATIDVDTTVKPSELDLTYHGWHSHEPLKRENGQWS